MRAIVFHSDSGEILREIDGSEQAIDNQILADEERIITEQDVPDWPNSLNSKKVDVDTREIIWDRNLTDAKSERIADIKDRANDVLAKTDWYVVRKQETGKSIPQDIVSHRSDVRSLSDEFESDVNNLDTIDDVMNYQFEYPEPPEL